MLVATHARQHPPELDESLQRQALAAPAAARPSTHSAVIRKVDKNGAIRFAGTAYFVGQAHCRHQVEVAPAKGTARSGATADSCAPTPSATTAESSTFANPSGRPDRINAA